MCEQIGGELQIVNAGSSIGWALPMLVVAVWINNQVVVGVRVIQGVIVLLVPATATAMVVKN